MKTLSPLKQAKLGLTMQPTPFEALPRLSEDLARQGPAPAIWVKRDDCTGLAGGGNKTRKLDYLVAEAIAQGADTLVTMGAIQSNHARQTAAAAAKAGLGCVLLLTSKIVGRGPNYATSGNILLSRVLGADIRVLAPEQDPATATEQTLAGLRAEGKRPYFIPIGGSNALGGLAYYEAMRELAEQAAAANRRIDHIVLATGSGGTHAGIVAGVAALGLDCTVHGVSVSRSVAEAQALVSELAAETFALAGQSGPLPEIVIDDTQIGPGYGVPTDAMIAAVNRTASLEGLLLDPVYTGKAMAGLIAKVGSGAFRPDETVVFWHTGGYPGLFAYDEVFR